MVVVAGQQPVQPRAHALTRGGRQLNDVNPGVDAAGKCLAARHVERQVRQQVHLVQNHQFGGGKHVGVFEGLVFALGDGQDGDLGPLTQVPHGGAHQVAHVFDEQEGGRSVGVVMVM